MLGKRKRGGSKSTASFKRTKPLDEVTFDFDKRQDYLTGFHKRKLQRAKHAQEQAAKQEREDKIVHRKEVRESRRKELEEHVKAVNHAVRRAEGLDSASEEESDASAEDGEWRGIDDAPTASTRKVDEYSDSDEEQEATVTIEAVDIDRDGMHVVASEGESEQDSLSVLPLPQPAPKASMSGNGKSKFGKGSLADGKARAPKKKKKFRYESKADRKLNRVKEKASKDRKRAKRSTED